MVNRYKTSDSEPARNSSVGKAFACQAGAAPEMISLMRIRQLIMALKPIGDATRDKKTGVPLVPKQDVCMCLPNILKTTTKTRDLKI